jgi:MFS transporter, UMF1 family
MVFKRKEIQPIQKGDKKVIRGWIMYDWANSVYQLTITTAVFPLYYNSVTGSGEGSLVTFFGAKVINTVIYSWAIAAAYIVLAFGSPFFSSIADYTGRRKTFMKVFTWIGALSCGMLFFFKGSNIELGIIAFALGTLGYGGSIVFYNSFLPVIAEPKDQDRISARGYSMGYLGGIILLLFNLFMIMKPELFGIPQGSSLPARISFLTVFLWWIGFSQITFLRLPKYTYQKRTHGANVLANGYKELQKVFNQVRRSYHLTVYLAGFFFTMMGLLSVMFMASLYGKKLLGLSDEVLIPTVLLIQLVGMFGAWLFARLSGRLGNLKALLISVVGWVLICVGAYFITGALGFITVAFFVGLVMGGTQSLARSTYSKMLPETTDHTSFFSFYDVVEKLATVIGTFSFGIIEQLTGSMRYSILAIGMFFITGLVFMLMLLRKGPGRQVLNAHLTGSQAFHSK